MEREIIDLKRQLQIAKSEIAFLKNFHDLGGKPSSGEDISAREIIWGVIRSKYGGSDETLTILDAEIREKIQNLKNSRIGSNFFDPERSDSEKERSG